MAEPWAKYSAEGGAGPWTKYAAAPPVPAAEQPGAVSRFLSSMGQALNPVPMVKDWWENLGNQSKSINSLGKILELRERGLKDDDPQMKAALDEAMGVKLPTSGNPAVTQVPFMSEPAIAAGRQAAEGDLAGAAGTVTGAYGVPAAIAGVSPYVKPAARAAGSVAAAVIDNPVAHDVAGVVSPRAAHAIALLRRGKRAAQAFNEPEPVATATPEPAAASAPPQEPAPVLEPAPAPVAPEASQPPTMAEIRKMPAAEAVKVLFENRQAAEPYRPSGSWRTGLSPEIQAQMEAQLAAKAARRSGAAPSGAIPAPIEQIPADSPAAPAALTAAQAMEQMRPQRGNVQSIADAPRFEGGLRLPGAGKPELTADAKPDIAAQLRDAMVEGGTLPTEAPAEAISPANYAAEARAAKADAVAQKLFENGIDSQTLKSKMTIPQWKQLFKDLGENEPGASSGDPSVTIGQTLLKLQNLEKAANKPTAAQSIKGIRKAAKKTAEPAIPAEVDSLNGMRVFHSNRNTGKTSADGPMWVTPNRQYAAGVGGGGGTVLEMDLPKSAKLVNLSKPSGYTPDQAVTALREAFPRATEAEIGKLIDRDLWGPQDTQHYDLPDLIHTTNEQPGPLLADLAKRHGVDGIKFQEAMQGSDVAHEGRFQKGRTRSIFVANHGLLKGTK